MSLKIRLKPNEKILISGAVLKNGDKAIEFCIENKVAILREKSIMKEEAVTTPGRRLYFLVQLMYVDSANLVNYHHSYWELVKEIAAAAPSTTPFLEEVSNLVLAQDYYHALKAADRLVEYESVLIARGAAG